MPTVPSITDFSPLEAGVTTPSDDIVVAIFDGGLEGAGHKQVNYTDFINGEDPLAKDPALLDFYTSVAEAGYATKGDSFAIDISIPNGADHETINPPGVGVFNQAIGVVQSGIEFVGDSKRKVEAVVDGVGHAKDAVVDHAADTIVGGINDFVDGANVLADATDILANKAADKFTDITDDGADKIEGGVRRIKDFFS